MNGQAVQLVGGREKVLEAGDPRPLAERFGRVGEIAVVDLDAAMEQGSNEDLIKDLLHRAPCRVGGGIRTVAQARRWLDAGAVRVVLGTAAVPEVLKQLPAQRVIAALDARHGRVMSRGWRHDTGRSIEEMMEELAPLVGGFLVTFIEHEGRLQGSDLERAAVLKKLAAGRSLTVAGGVTTAEEIARLDELGMDAQVGMALYTGKLDLGDAFTASLNSDRPDGLWPTVVSDENGKSLGLCWSSAASVRQALSTGRGVYHSRRRGTWIKGESSNATQELLGAALDCDGDALRFTVRQQRPGFCHQGTWSCWGDDRGFSQLIRRLADRGQAGGAASYTARLLQDPDLLRAKLREEAAELAAATERDDAIWEAADVLYFTAVAMVRAGITLEEVEGELDRRAQQFRSEETAARGNAKGEDA